MPRTCPGAEQKVHLNYVLAGYWRRSHALVANIRYILRMFWLATCVDPMPSWRSKFTLRNFLSGHSRPFQALLAITATEKYLVSCSNRPIFEIKCPSGERKVHLERCSPAKGSERMKVQGKGIKITSRGCSCCPKVVIRTEIIYGNDIHLTLWRAFGDETIKPSTLL